jgi:hypothetical protein
MKAYIFVCFCIYTYTKTWMLIAIYYSNSEKVKTTQKNLPGDEWINRMYNYIVANY